MCLKKKKKKVRDTYNLIEAKYKKYSKSNKNYIVIKLLLDKINNVHYR